MANVAVLLGGVLILAFGLAQLIWREKVVRLARRLAGTVDLKLKHAESVFPVIALGFTVIGGYWVFYGLVHLIWHPHSW